MCRLKRENRQPGASIQVKVAGGQNARFLVRYKHPLVVAQNFALRYKLLRAVAQKRALKSAGVKINRNKRLMGAGGVQLPKRAHDEAWDPL